MYKKPPENIVELFGPFPPEIKELGEEIRKEILDALPKAEENVYGGKKVGNVLYSVGGKNHVVCGMQPQEKFIRVFFHNWEKLKDAGYQVEGSGKNARHVKIESLSDLDNLELKKMINLVKK